jgi:hypothetical protein
MYQQPGLKTVLSRRSLTVPQETLLLPDLDVQNYRDAHTADNSRFGKLSSLLPCGTLRPVWCLLLFQAAVGKGTDRRVDRSLISCSVAHRCVDRRYFVTQGP